MRSDNREVRAESGVFQGLEQRNDQRRCSPRLQRLVHALGIRQRNTQRLQPGFRVALARGEVGMDLFRLR